jgi:hypothetical protein
VSRVKELLAGNGEQEQVEIFKASPVGTQWLVGIKPKLRYAGQCASYFCVVEGIDERSARYEASRLHPHVFNTLDRHYNAPVAHELSVGKLCRVAA